MVKIYKKGKNFNYRKSFKALGLLFILLGVFLTFYSLFPLISWQLFFSQSFAAQNIQSPIPNALVLDSKEIQSLIRESKNNLVLDYTNATNWYPNFEGRKLRKFTYRLSIPRLGLSNLIVSTSDNDLSKHLVNYQGTAIPPDKGNAVIFGHSTLPQLFNPSDYKTIFANAYKLSEGDEIIVREEKVSYTYKIFQIIVVEPEDTSVLSQKYNDSQLTLITCTPPGTVWKRLVIKAKLV